MCSLFRVLSYKIVCPPWPETLPAPLDYTTPILKVFPLHQVAHVVISLSMCLKLFGREIIFEVFQPM